MYKTIYKYLFVIAISALMLFMPISVMSAKASEQDASYRAYVIDYADILSDEEEEELYNTMLDGTAYGNMIFMTIDDAHNYETKDYIEMLYRTSDKINGTNAVIFMIDMDNRMLWISGYEDNEKLITSDYANLITDNVYRYAKRGDYITCAQEGFSQIIKRLANKSVSGALRSVGNLCIALISALVICFLLAYVTSVARKTKDDIILDNIDRNINIQNPRVKKGATRRIYDPPSSSSGSSTGGGHGGGGGGHGGGHGF